MLFRSPVMNTTAKVGIFAYKVGAFCLFVCKYLSDEGEGLISYSIIESLCGDMAELVFNKELVNENYILSAILT